VGRDDATRLDIDSGRLQIEDRERFKPWIVHSSTLDPTSGIAWSTHVEPVEILRSEGESE
jgi:hypothetical protein